MLDDNESVPVKWYAPEALIDSNDYSVSSDVWSFGILMWEILEFGKQPFPNMSIRAAWEEIPKGARLDRPKNCPNDLWLILASCWEINPEARPNFIQILKLLQMTAEETHSTYMENGSVPFISNSNGNNSDQNYGTEKDLDEFYASKFKNSESNYLHEKPVNDNFFHSTPPPSYLMENEASTIYLQNPFKD